MRLSLDLGLGSIATIGSGSGASPVTILGASLLAWWTADRSDLITLSGSAVTSWKDVVAGYDAVQGVGASRPVYSATSFNGAPSLTSDGVDDELTCTDAALLAALPAAALPSEIWAIADQSALVADTPARNIAAYGNGVNVGRRLQRDVAGGNQRGQARAGTGASSTVKRDALVDLSSRHVMRAIFTATAVNVSVDGSVNVQTAAVPATTNSRVRLFASDTAVASQFWFGGGRDILFTTPLSADQATALLAWALPRRML